MVLQQCYQVIRSRGLHLWTSERRGLVEGLAMGTYLGWECFVPTPLCFEAVSSVVGSTNHDALPCLSPTSVEPIDLKLKSLQLWPRIFSLLNFFSQLSFHSDKKPSPTHTLFFTYPFQCNLLFFCPYPCLILVASIKQFILLGT